MRIAKWLFRGCQCVSASNTIASRLGICLRAFDRFTSHSGTLQMRCSVRSTVNVVQEAADAGIAMVGRALATCKAEYEPLVLPELSYVALEVWFL